ncbi:MAG: SDR family NAD(P)-dependent oxidoreductase [Brevundimonas sp.]|uniref:SDR family NAD(P)-dependent oxidoreductase n=1 Tax=Brevundimonas sp. TaxID=1871086 RepID=UPI0024898720|nr:SDR family NAD(P)-dependent oxidoreductase [Brevundimonas sp.]MDI1327580.1 SDR family NAD(P)-dependent oxidoreductase [Brevundimonas sp.]
MTASAADRGVALVTGAAGGLGRAIVRTLAAEGYTVLGVDLQAFDAPEAARTWVCDLTDFDGVRRMLDEIVAAFGAPAVLVNNAAFYRFTPFFELSMEQVAQTLAVNITAPLYLCQQVGLAMRDNGRGAIVNVSSIAGRRGSSQVDYGASKAAVINFTMTLARIMAPLGIRVNAVAPALVDAGLGPKIEPHVRDAFLNQTPMKRAATAGEVADVIAFLAGDRSTYVTGETIDVHGGL